MKKAGVGTVDYLVITHYHADHVGGMEQLASRVKFRNVITHGPTTETGQGRRHDDGDLSRRAGGKRRERDSSSSPATRFR